MKFVFHIAVKKQLCFGYITNPIQNYEHESMHMQRYYLQKNKNSRREMKHINLRLLRHR